MTAWPGWTPENTLILPLDEAAPGTAVELDGDRFDPKSELHVTLVGTALGRELRATLGDRLDAATRPAFEALDWSLARTGEAALLRRPRGEASIIEFVELPAMAFFHRWLGELLGRQLPVPPPHVTLYTQGRDRGIGVPTPRALRTLLRSRLDLAALRPA